ncbi:MAG: hypothetical protein V1820_01560 [archaeon]
MLSSREKWALPAFAFLVAALLVASSLVFVGQERLIYPNVLEFVSAGNISALYSYLSGRVDVGQSPGEGGITVVAYLRTGDKGSREFLETVLPKLENEFLKSGKVAYLQKEYLTLLDIERKTPEFISALSTLCERSEEACARGQEIPEELLRSAGECSRFGVPGLFPMVLVGRAGRENTELVGIPEYSQLRKVLRQHLMEAGE